MKVHGEMQEGQKSQRLYPNDWSSRNAAEGTRASPKFWAREGWAQTRVLKRQLCLKGKARCPGLSSGALSQSRESLFQGCGLQEDLRGGILETYRMQVVTCCVAAEGEAGFVSATQIQIFLSSLIRPRAFGGHLRSSHFSWEQSIKVL